MTVAATLEERSTGASSSAAQVGSKENKRGPLFCKGTALEFILLTVLEEPLMTLGANRDSSGELSKPKCLFIFVHYCLEVWAPFRYNAGASA